MDTDIHLKLESGLAARVDSGSNGVGCGLILRFQVRLSNSTVITRQSIRRQSIQVEKICIPYRHKGGRALGWAHSTRAHSTFLAG
jgi:hypothetical protein